MKRSIGIHGSRLNGRQRAQVLAAFVHRHTVENAQRRGVRCVLCADSGGNRLIIIPAGQQAAGEVRKRWHDHHVQAQTDEQWIAEHAFHFVKDGSRLHGRRNYAESGYLAEEEAKA